MKNYFDNSDINTANIKNNFVIISPTTTEKKDGKECITFEKGSILYGTKDRDLELKTINHEEYEPFK